MTTTRTITALLAGALLAFAYSLSPLTAWCLVGLCLATAVALRGIEGAERVWMMRIIALAVLLRVLVLAIFFIATHHGAAAWFAPLLPDETYIAQRSIWLRNMALDVPMPTIYYVDSYSAYARTNFHDALALVQMWLGPASYGLRMLSGVLYVTGALMMYRVARDRFGRVAAAGSLAAVLFLPTLFVWSISVVKEAPFAFLMSVTLAASTAAARPRVSVPQRVGCIAVALIALYLLRGLRPNSEMMIGAGVAGGIVIAALLRRPVLFVAACVVVAAVVFVAVRRPAITSRVENQFRAMAAIHVGHVMTRGYGYKLLDPEFYPGGGHSLADATARMDDGALTRFVLRAAASVVLVPLPWQAQSGPAVALLPEQVVWYLLVACALAGVVAGLRRDLTLTIVLCAVVCSSAVVVGVTNGNIGTLVRIREIVVVPMLWLSGPGVSAVVNRLASWRVQPAAPPLKPARA